MSKKSLKIQTNKMLAAALFTLLCVGIYAHVDGFVTRRELTKVLGQETTAVRAQMRDAGESSFSSGFLNKMWCRIKYGRKCEQMMAEQEKKTEVTIDETTPTDVLIERELKNLENEIKNDTGSEQTGSYWSM